MSKRLFIAKDGSYGDADGLIIIDVEEWHEEDFERLDNAGDGSRIGEGIEIAMELADRIFYVGDALDALLGFDAATTTVTNFIKNTEPTI